MQVPRDEVGGADHIDQRQPRRRRPAGVQPQQGLGVDLVSARDEGRASETQACATPHQAHRGRARAGRERQADVLEHVPAQIEASIDVSADQELFRGPALQFDVLRACGAFGGAQVGVRRFGRTAGIRQRGGQAFPPRRRRRGGWGQIEGMLVERRGSVERQCRPRLLRREPGLHRCALVIAGAAIVLEQRVAVVALPRDQRGGHARVEVAHSIGPQAVNQHFTNPIVIGLHPVGRPTAADQARGAQHHDQRLPVARDATGVADDLRRDRTAADRERLEKEARRRRQGLDARREQRGRTSAPDASPRPTCPRRVPAARARTGCHRRRAPCGACHRWSARARCPPRRPRSARPLRHR